MVLPGDAEVQPVMASAMRILFSFLWASRATSLAVGCVTPFDAPPPIKDLVR